MVIARDPGRPFLVGTLYSQTGPTAFVERTQFNAALLAIEDINDQGGIAGRPVEPVSHDAQSDPQRFSMLAQHMLDEDRVDLLVGCYMSSTRQAVIPVVERRAALLTYTAPYEGFEYSPNVIYGGAVPNQHILMLARYLITHVGSRVYLVGTRYAFPIECNRVMMTLVAEQKGQVLAERYVPLQAKEHELRQIVADIKKKAPDVVFCTVVGEAAAIFYKLCQEAGVTATTQIASLTITEAELARMPDGLAEGHLTAATYFQSIDTPANHAFVARYKARFGNDDPLNAMAETAYCATAMTLAAIGRCLSVDPDIVKQEMAKTGFAAPQGEIRLDPENSHFYLWPRIGRVDSRGAFEIIKESPVAVKPDPYLINHSLADWNVMVSDTPGPLVGED
jgi:branched-chain amino acid transport system substrate-binding protein